MKQKYLTQFTAHTRHLRHFEEPGATYHIVFTLRESAICDLCSHEIAPIVLGAFAFYANERYYLYDHTIMPDHVHAIFQPMSRADDAVESLGNIVGDIKRYTAHAINKILQRKGPLWLDESYDHIIRNEDEYQKTAQYIFENPVRAGLIEDAEQWKWWSPGIEPEDEP